MSGENSTTNEPPTSAAPVTADDGPGDRENRGYRLFEWINGHVAALAAAVLVASVVLAVLSPVVADDGEPPSPV